MVGDLNDMLGRIKQLLPLRWFPDNTPVLDLVLNGIAWSWSWSYQLLETAKAQARISTAQGVWLDLISQDFFGASLRRRNGESDTDFCRRIKGEIVRERGTRGAIINAVQFLTGHFPSVFEPANPSDTGSYGAKDGAGGGLAYGEAGGWGSLALPLQVFVSVARPASGGIAFVTGWTCGNGGYGEGSIEYASLSGSQGAIQDGDIYSSIARVLPIGTVAWTRIMS
jgi:hypothetical protein